MTVCYFGVFNPNYIRNKVLIEGLRRNGVDVVLCQDTSRGYKKYLALSKKYWAISHSYGIMVVGFFDQLMAVFARLIGCEEFFHRVFVCLSPLYELH